jgi:hypothetical protein
MYQVLCESAKELGYKLSNTILQNNSQNNNPYLLPLGLALIVGGLISLGFTIRHVYKNKIKPF